MRNKMTYSKTITKSLGYDIEMKSSLKNKQQPCIWTVRTYIFKKIGYQARCQVFTMDGNIYNKAFKMANE